MKHHILSKLLLSAVMLSVASLILRAGVGSASTPKSKAGQTTVMPHVSNRRKQVQDPVMIEFSRCSGGYLKDQIAKATLLIAKDPKDFNAYKRRGLANWKLDKCHLAIADLDAVLALAPEKTAPDVYRVLGQCYAGDGFPEKAIEIFTASLKLYPTYQDTFLSRSQAYAVLKKYDKAIDDANKVVDSSSTSSWAYDYRAKLNFFANRYKEAIEDCTTSIRLDPNSFNAYDLRSKSYTKLGKLDLANQDRRRLSELVKTVF